MALRPLIFLSAIVALSLAIPAGAADSNWAITDAPYRAVVRLSNPPNVPDAGVAIDLPEMGQTLAGLTDVVLTDADGRQQLLAPIWRYEGARAVLNARELKPKQDYHVYFGGGKARRGLGGWLPRQGLFMETRRLPAGAKFDSWSDMEAMWRRATEVDGGGYVSAIYHGLNPFGESQNFCSHYSGYLMTGKAKEVFLYTQSCDASFVLVNGKFAFEWSGKHPAHANERTVKGATVPCSTDGLTKVDYYHCKGAELQPGPSMDLGWRQGGKLKPVPFDQFVHPGSVTIERIEDIAGRPVPWVTVRLESCLGYSGYFLVHAALSVPEKNLDGWTVQWAFDDGGGATGPKAERVLVGLRPMRAVVQMTRGKETVRGVVRIDFAQETKEASVNEPADMAKYVELLTRDNASQLSLKALRPAVVFLREFGNEQAAAGFADAYLRKSNDSSDPAWLHAMLARLRSLEQRDPKQALVEMRRIDANARKRHARSLDLFEMELLVFYLRDPAAIQRAMQIGMDHQGSDIALIAKIRVGDLYRLQGRYKEAIEQYQSVQRAITDESGGRKQPAQDRAYSVAVQEMLLNGFRQEVEAKLQEWECAHPMAKLESDFLLQRARFLETLGRWGEALTELDSFEKLKPDSPYQIDITFYRAKAMFELGRKDEARKMWAEIASKYPKHPLARESRQLAERK